MQNSPTLMNSLVLLTYNVKHVFHRFAYPLVILIISPDWTCFPNSSHLKETWSYILLLMLWLLCNVLIFVRFFYSVYRGLTNSTYIERLMEPDLSATLTVRTSWPSFVLVGLLTSRTMNISEISFWNWKIIASIKLTHSYVLWLSISPDLPRI